MTPTNVIKLSDHQKTPLEEEQLMSDIIDLATRINSTFFKGETLDVKAFLKDPMYQEAMALEARADQFWAGKRTAFITKFNEALKKKST